MHHEYKRRTLLVASKKLPHVLSKLSVVLPLFKAVLKEIRRIVLVAVQYVFVETLFAEDLPVVDLKVVSRDCMAEVWNLVN